MFKKGEKVYKGAPLLRTLLYNSTRTLCRLGLAVCIFSLPCNSVWAQTPQHSVTITWAQQAQIPTESVVNVQIIRDGKTLVTLNDLTILSYTDLAVNAGESHSYSLVNIDSNGIPSLPTTPVTVVVPGQVTQTTSTFGSVTAGASTDSSDSNFLTGSRYVSGPTGGTATLCSAFIGAVAGAPNNKGECVVYSDAGVLIAQSSQVVLKANSQNDFPITFSVAPNTAYLVMYNTNGLSVTSNNLKYDSGGASSQYRWMHNTFGTYPTAYKTTGSSNLKGSIFITYVSGTAPPPPTASIVCTGLTCTFSIANVPSGTTYTGPITFSDGITVQLTGVIP